MSRERHNEPWHQDFVQAIETFQIPGPRLVRVRNILEVFAIILEAWEDHHMGEHYWAGITDESLFGRFYNVLRDPQATATDILIVSNEIVRYLKTLIFVQVLAMILTSHGLRGPNITDVNDPYHPRNPNRVPSLLNYNSNAWVDTLCEDGSPNTPSPAGPAAAGTAAGTGPAHTPLPGPQPMGPGGLLAPLMPLPPAPPSHTMRQVRPLQRGGWPDEPQDPARRRAPPPPWDNVTGNDADACAVRMFLRPGMPFNMAPRELARTTAWYRLRTVVHAVRTCGLPHATGLITTTSLLDCHIDLCLDSSGLAARLQWYLAMVLVGEDRGAAETLARVQRFDNVFAGAAAFALNNVRVRVAGFRRGLAPGLPNRLDDAAAAGGPRTLAALADYSSQLLHTVHSLRMMRMWQDRPGSLAARFRLRIQGQMPN